MKVMNRLLYVIGIAGVLSSCGTLNKIPESELKDDHYHFRQPGEHYTKVYVDVNDDSLAIIPADKNASAIKPVKSDTDELFLKRGFDIDLLVAPFKYRPSSSNFPRQLTADFNGNVFFGYRLDRFRVHYTKTPTGIIKQIHHRAMTIGTFGGIGTSSITPWTTNYLTTDEYNGFILIRGLSLMFGVNNLTVGLGVGWDYLTDRDKNIWIYQNKAWYGVTVSINLN
jgi:hypothetical protein